MTLYFNEKVKSIYQSRTQSMIVRVILNIMCHTRDNYIVRLMYFDIWYSISSYMQLIAKNFKYFFQVMINRKFKENWDRNVLGKRSRYEVKSLKRALIEHEGQRLLEVD